MNQGIHGAESPIEWLKALPPVTRLWLVACVGLSITNYVSPPHFLTNMIWSWTLFWHKREWWRAATSLLFLGEANHSLLINLLFLYQNSVDCENELRWKSSLAYPGRLALGAALVLCGATFFDEPAPSLGFVMYVQSLRCLNNPFAPVNFFSFHMKAFYLPFACLAFHYCIEGSDVTIDLIGMAAALIVHFGLKSTGSFSGLLKRRAHQATAGFKVGDAVMVQNVQSQVNLNGLAGNVQAVLDNGRCEVFLPDLQRVLALKFECLVKV